MAGSFQQPHPSCIMARKPGVVVDRVVIHTMEGTLKGTISWFKQGAPPRGVATCAHYLVGNNGDIVQMVPDKEKCYHANSYNSRSIGIEHEGWSQVGAFPDAMLEASAKVAAIMCKKFGFPADRKHIVGHDEVPDSTHRDPGPHWPWDRYMALVEAAFKKL